MKKYNKAVIEAAERLNKAAESTDPRDVQEATGRLCGAVVDRHEALRVKRVRRTPCAQCDGTGAHADGRNWCQSCGGTGAQPLTGSVDPDLR